MKSMFKDNIYGQAQAPGEAAQTHTPAQFEQNVQKTMDRALASHATAAQDSVDLASRYDTEITRPTSTAY